MGSGQDIEMAAQSLVPWQKKPPPLQPLLLWQSVSLFWFMGIFSLRWPLPTLCALLIIVYIDRRLWATAPLLLATLLFGMGYGSAHMQLAPRPPYPPWALTAHNIPHTFLWEGTVTKVEGLTDGRLRIFLQDIKTTDQNATVRSLEGGGIWTWDFSRAGTTHSQEHPQYFRVPPKRPVAGQRVYVNSKLYSSESFRNFYAPSYGFYWRTQSIFWRFWSRAHAEPDPHAVSITGIAYPSAKMRERVRQHFERAIFSASLDEHNASPVSPTTPSIHQQARAFLPALLFGDKFFLHKHTITLMTEASLVHSLALSGQHLALAGLLACVLVGILEFIFSSIYLRITRKHLIACTSLVFASMYLWLGNAPPSLLRASIMLSLGVVFFWYHKARTLGDIVLMTVLFISFYAPLSIFDISLQLSVLCVGSIALIMPVLRRIPQPSQRFKVKAPIRYTLYRVFRAAVQIFLISLTIQCIMMPIFLHYFPPSGEWFIVNVLWLPILSIWVLPLAALSCFVSFFFPTAPFLSFLITCAALPCEWLLSLLHWLEPYFSQSAVLRPHWSALLALTSICVALGMLVGRTKHMLPHCFIRLIYVSAVFFCVGSVMRFADKWHVSVEMLDVGQGQAVFIQLPGGYRLLVDGGGGFSPRFDVGKALVVPRLVANANPQLTTIINTHPDTDHTRGLLGVMESMDVNTLYTNGQAWNKQDFQRYKKIADKPPMQTLHAGMHLPLFSLNTIFPFIPKLSIEVLHPPAPHAREKTVLNTNNASLVLRVVEHRGAHKRGLVLLCGDIQKKAIHTLLNSQQDISADVLILPHHASQSSLVPALYDAVKPRLALASMGRHNAFGFPHQSVQDALRQRHIPLLTTATHGAVRVTFWPFSSILHVDDM